MAFEFHISTGNSTPIYRQIVDQVCRGVALGALKLDDQLPSVRELAERLVVNPNTVARAYGELVRDGIAEARQGKGVFVTQRRQVYSEPERRRRLEQALDQFINDAVYLDFGAEDIRRAVDKRLADLHRALKASTVPASSGAHNQGRRS